MLEYCGKKGHQIKCEQNNSKLHSPESDKCDKSKSISVLQLKAFKLQNRVEDHRKMVHRIKEMYGSLSKAAKCLNVHYCTFWHLCQTPNKGVSNKRTEEMKDKMETLSNFYNQKSVTTNLPTARMAKKQFLTTTYEEAHSKYVQWCNANGIPFVPFGTFYRLKPCNVYSVGKIPENQCCCKLCQNFHLGKSCILQHKIKGIGSTTSELIMGSMCPVTDVTDGKSTVAEYGYYDCISRNCSKCGKKKTFPDIYKQKIIKANPGIKHDNEIIKWKRWETTIRIGKDGKPIKRLDKFTKETTKIKFLEYFIKDMHDMAIHMFNWKWQDMQFEYLKDTLRPGMLIQVLDFAQNYLHKLQDEPKECHWDHAQTVLHPIVNYRRCPKDGKLIVEEHIIVSDDLNHDKYAVKAFEDASLRELKNNGFEPTHLFQFCDNCSCQYKSKGPFQFISTSERPCMRCYFGPNHGKGPSDSATGRVKGAIVRGRNARVSELRNSFEVYEFLKMKFTAWEKKRIENSGDKCVHFFQKSMFVTNINRDTPISAITTNGSTLFYSVRSTGHPMIIEAKKVSCMCPSCVFGEPGDCPNYDYSDPWLTYNLERGKKIDNSENNHWGFSNAIPTPDVSVTDGANGSDVTDGDGASILNVSPDANVTDGAPAAELDLPTRVANCQNFDQLNTVFSSQVAFDPLEYTVVKLLRIHRLDDKALGNKPGDAPRNYLPVEVGADGNCFTRALAIAIGKDEDTEHKDLRMRICREGVENKNRYLDHNYLSYGMSHLPGRCTLPILFAQFSEYTQNFGCRDGETRSERIARWSKIAEKIYKKETFESRRNGEYMGIWQFFQAANVIKRPICSVYPNMFTEDFRRQLNRTIFPFNVGEREREPIYIMWTCTVSGGRPNHFVPLLKS